MKGVAVGGSGVAVPVAVAVGVSVIPASASAVSVRATLGEAVLVSAAATASLMTSSSASMTVTSTTTCGDGGTCGIQAAINPARVSKRKNFFALKGSFLEFQTNKHNVTGNEFALRQHGIIAL